MRKTLKQWTAITCALVMIAGLLPVSILAEDSVATPTDLAPVAELVLEVEPAEEPVENTVEESAEEPAESAIEESVEEPATEPEEEKVTYTARIAAAKRDGKIFLTAFVEPELVGKVTWEMKRPGQADEKWTRIKNDSPTLVIVPGSELIGKEIRFRLEDGTTPILNYIVPELEPEEAPEAGTEEPDVEINQEKPATDNEIVPVAEEPVEESADETSEEPKTEAEPAIEEVIVEEPAKEEQVIEDYETPLGLDDITATELEIQEEIINIELNTVINCSDDVAEEAEMDDEPTIEGISAEEPIEAEENVDSEISPNQDDIAGTDPEIQEESAEKESDSENNFTEEEPTVELTKEQEEKLTNQETDVEAVSSSDTANEIMFDVREEANGLSPILVTVPVDAELIILEVNGDWVKVAVEEQIGFIYKADLMPYIELPTDDDNMTDEPEMKVNIFTSRRSVMTVGEDVQLTSKLEGFDGYEIRYIWMCDKHDGSGFQAVEGGNSDSYTFQVSAESLRWDWQLKILYR